MRHLVAVSLRLCLLPALLLAACGDDGGGTTARPDAQVPPGQPDAAPGVPPDGAPPASSLVLSSAEITVNEGDAAGVTLAVKLAAAPGQAVAVTVVSSDETAAIADPVALSFDDANFDTDQTITVTAVDDADGDNETVTLTLSAAGLGDVTVSVTVIDDEGLNILVDSSTVSVIEGVTSTFTVRLTVAPPADVIVTIASSDEAAATVSPTTLTFTAADFDQPQTVTVTGVEDADTLNAAATLTLSAAGLADVAVAVTVDDNDDSQTILASASSLSVDEGSTTTFTVSLSTAPQGTLDVTLASSDLGAASISPATLSFDATNFDQPQTVTITGEADADASDETVNVTLSATGAADATVAIAVIDITPPLAVDMFVLGSFNGNGTTDPLVYEGNRTYVALVTLAKGTHQFKIADASFTAATTFSVSAANQATIRLDTPTTLVSAPGAGNETLFTANQAAIYRFELVVADPAAPVLTISRQQRI
jgi:hypothetical protein